MPCSRAQEEKCKDEKRTIEVKRSTYSITSDEKKFRVIDGNVHMRGRREMLVDDAYNHGTNMGKLSRVVEVFGGTIVGAVAVLDRSQQTGSQTTLLLPGSRRSVPVLSLIRRPMDDWDPADCRAEMLSRNYDPSLCSITPTTD